MSSNILNKKHKTLCKLTLKKDINAEDLACQLDKDPRLHNIDICLAHMGTLWGIDTSM